MASKNSKCPNCGSKNLCYGKLGNSHPFLPEEAKTFFAGFEPNSFVCLDCGDLGHYLDQKQIDALKERLSIGNN